MNQLTFNRSLHRQQGISLVGLILTIVVIVMLATLAMKIVPTVIEYNSIRKAIFTARDAGSSVIEIRSAFDRQANVGYFDAVTGKDLTIVKKGDEFVVSFAYDKKVPLFGPASILLEYNGTTEK